MRLVIAGGVGVSESIAVGIVVATTRLEGNCRVGGRTTLHIAKCARGTHRQKPVYILRSQRVAGLEDAGATGSPSAGQVANSAPATVRPFQRIVEAEREAVGHVKDRRSVILPRIEPGRVGIVQRVILRTRTRVGSVDEATQKVSPQIEDRGVVVAVAIIVRVGYFTKALIEPGRARNDPGRAGVLLPDQVTRKGVDVHPIGNVPDGVAVADDVVGVGAVVTHARGKIASKLPLQRNGPHV